MTSWVLILMMTHTTGNPGPTALATAVFYTEAACMSAANAWLAQAKTVSWSNARALCAKAS